MARYGIFNWGGNTQTPEANLDEDYCNDAFEQAFDEDSFPGHVALRSAFLKGR